MPKVTLFCDGGSRGNPGPAAAGALFFIGSNFVDPEDQNSLTPYWGGSKHLGNTTNNQAEWQAVILGLEEVSKVTQTNATQLQIYLDSELVVKQITGIYKVKKPELKPHYTEVHKLLKPFHSWQVNHIYRHLNKLADTFVNEELDKS